MNRAFPHLFGDLCVGCWIDVFHRDDSGCVDGVQTIALPMRELLSKEAMNMLIRSFPTRTSQQLSLKLDKERVGRAFRQALEAPMRPAMSLF